MPAILTGGPRSMALGIDKDGHREYKITFRVEVTVPTADGPAVAANCPGLPVVGSYWIIRNDVDVWAWCRPDTEVRAEKDGEPSRFWDVTKTFSTKPLQRCSERNFEDPLLEPMKISGSFTKYQEEATHDRFGAQLVNSSHEQIRGPQVEFDKNRPQVKIEQNVPLLQLDTCAALVDCVNINTMWGLPPRTVKLSNFSWERKFHGLCNVYYTRSFEFDVNYSTWDRTIMDEGSKVIKGHWDADANWVLDKILGVDPNPFNPSHFIKATDFSGNPMKVLLNGAGFPADVNTGAVYTCTKAVIASPGNNYAEGERIVITGGTRTQAVILQVAKTATGGTGQIETLRVLVKGRYTALPPNPAVELISYSPVPGGAAIGTGASFTLTFKLIAANHTSVGSRYVEKYASANLFTLGIPSTLG